MRKAYTLVEILVVMGIIAILIALLIPAVQRVRESANRTKCSNNLKQVGLAVLNYETIIKKFPSQTGIESRCWMYHILPYIERQDIHAGALTNRDLFCTPITTYLCPSDPRPLDNMYSQTYNGLRYAMTSYLGNAGSDYNKYPDDGVIGCRGYTVKMREILNGTSNTFMIGERPPGGGGNNSTDPIYWGWWSYTHFDSTLWVKMPAFPNIRDQKGNSCPAKNDYGLGNFDDDCCVNHYWSLHNGGGNFAFADGSVRFLEYSIDLSKLASRK